MSKIKETDRLQKMKKSDRFLEVNMVECMDDHGNTKRIPLKSCSIPPEARVEVRIRIIRENTIIFDELEEVEDE